MAVRIATDLGDILTKLEAAIVSNFSVAAAYVFTTFSDDDEIAKVTPADKFVTLTPEGQAGDMGLAAGPGRTAVGIDSDLTVCLWSRTGLDQVGRDKEWLRNTSRGALVSLKSLMNTLHLYDPQDATPNWILQEPMRLKSWRCRRRREKPAGWGVLETHWELKYLQPLS